MTLIEHTLETTAPPEDVWAVLEATAQWPEWNTLTAAAPGGFEEGQAFKLGVIIGSRTLPVTATFVQVERERHLVWQGGVPGVFGARHGFDLTPLDSGGTRIRHHEDFRGLLHYPLLFVLGDRQVRTYEKVNKGLARAAEAISGS